MQFSIGIFAMVAYVAYSIFFCVNSQIALCYIPFLISYMLDVTWLFFGQEDFKIILARNLIVKVITAVAIFALVRSQEDVVMYILIMSLGALLSQLLIWPKVLKDNRLIKVKTKEIAKHLKPNIILFIPVIAVSIYRTMDKIMLGSMSSMTQVGYYENAEKLISILLSFITALGTVMLPRMAALYESKNQEQIQKMLSNSFVFVSFAASVVACGVAVIADDFVVIYYGTEYLASGMILKLLCITVPCISYANIVRMQILVPQGRDKAYVISCFSGAIVNLIVNAILIPSYQANGAAIGTIAAEITVLVVQVFGAKEKIYIKPVIKSIISFWINGVIMLLVVHYTQYIFDNIITRFIMSVAIGALVYVICCVLLQGVVFKDYFVNSILNRLLKKKKENANEKN